MRFGFVVPFADARDFASLAKRGEDAGWDAVFTWEAVYGVDTWVTLGGAAMVTELVDLPGTPADRAAAGATWWVESWWTLPRGGDGLAAVRRRVEAGPPAL